MQEKNNKIRAPLQNTITPIYLRNKICNWKNVSLNNAIMSSANPFCRSG